MKVVLFDTNFFLIIEMQGIDVFGEITNLVAEEHELATLSSVVGELEKMQASNSKRGVAARVALKLIQQKEVKVYETNLKADQSIIDFSLRNKDVIVCTNDRELKKELKKNNIKVISPRGKKYLTFV